MKFFTLILAVALLVLAACTPTPAAPKLTADMLTIEKHELSARPDLASGVYNFKSIDGQEFTAADLSAGESFPLNQVGEKLAYSVTLNGATIIAEEVGTEIVVTRDGKEIFRTPTGGISPMPSLQSLWAYDDHWVLETNLFQEDKPFNGQVFLDGESIGQKNGYDEVFNFQTFEGRPFYFFRHGGKVDASFDGEVIQLGYDDIPHYACCGDSEYNPRAFKGTVIFFGKTGETWYFARISSSPSVLK